MANDKNQTKQVVKDLLRLNPITDIRKEFSKLNGEWMLDYTTTPVSEVPDESSGIKTYQTIDKTSKVENPSRILQPLMLLFARLFHSLDQMCF